MYLAVEEMSLWRLFMLSFFPRDVLHEISDLIESVSEVFLPTLLKPRGLFIG